MTTHPFQPDHYFRTMGTHEPVLHICPGDHVVTTALDAAGRDATGEQIVPGWNPMTGPFFVEGAEPGDRLAVHLICISPNRPTGWSSWELDPSIVEPGTLLWILTFFISNGLLNEIRYLSTATPNYNSLRRA